MAYWRRKVALIADHIGKENSPLGYSSRKLGFAEE